LVTFYFYQEHSCTGHIYHGSTTSNGLVPTLMKQDKKQIRT